jgi:hypothetical protein
MCLYCLREKKSVDARWYCIVACCIGTDRLLFLSWCFLIWSTIHCPISIVVSQNSWILKNANITVKAWVVGPKFSPVRGTKEEGHPDSTNLRKPVARFCWDLVPATGPRGRRLVHASEPLLRPPMNKPACARATCSRFNQLLTTIGNSYVLSMSEDNISNGIGGLD